MSSCRRFSNSVLAWTTMWAMLQSWCILVRQANAESLELRVDQVSGLTKDLKGRTEYLISVHACSPVCTLIGYESLAEKTAAHVLSAEGIRGSFRLSIKLHRRTRPPPQERGLIPVEVVEREGLASDPSDGSKIESGMIDSVSHSSFESLGRVLLTGSRVGERGNLNHNWRETEELIGEYMIDTTTAAVRRCRKSCLFHSDSTFVQKIISNSTVDTPAFRLQLTAFAESSREKASPNHLLLAAHFAEAAENSRKEDIFLPFEFPGETTRKMRNSPRLVRSNSPKCRKYRFITSVGDEVAFVWYVSNGNGDDAPVPRDRLDTDPNQGATVIAFKDIEKSSNAYIDTWGRNELSPVSFTSSSTYDHFEILGKAHSGFHKRYNQVSEELRTWVRPGTKVLVTGAFVGGAVASLAFADWLSDRDMDLGLSYGITFGAPQVGDKQFQKFFRELGRFEPSKVSFGFFEQLVASDEKTGKVDLATNVPSAIFEGLVPYPGIHSIDCLRSVLPVERTALSAPGHLRAFRSVGRRRYLYSGRRLAARVETKFLEAKSTISNDTLQNMASSAFIIHGNVISHYMERLYSLYYDLQEMRYFQVLRTATRIQQIDHVNPSLQADKCIQTSAQQAVQALAVDVEVSTKSERTLWTKSIALHVCDNCKKEADPSCRPLLIVGDASNTAGELVQQGQKTQISFLSLRPLADNVCIQFQSNKMYNPPTCATDVLPKESMTLASSQLIDRKELLDCTREQRCRMQFDGMTMLISGEMRNVFNETDLVERAGFSRDGVLIRGAATPASSASDSQLHPSSNKATLHSAADDTTARSGTVEKLRMNIGQGPTRTENSIPKRQILKPARQAADSRQSPGRERIIAVSTSARDWPTSAGGDESRIGQSAIAESEGHALRLGDLAGGLRVGENSRGWSEGRGVALSGECESGRHCKCVSTTVRGCATPVAGQLGWCSVEACERMRCSCDGTERCEKTETLVFEVVEAVRGVRYARCESRIEQVAVRVGMGEGRLA